MDTTDFEVIKGDPQEKPVRLGIVRGSKRATDLMYGMYARLPGSYFIVDASTKEVVTSLHRKASTQNGREPNFEIFFGAPDKNAVWVEAVEGLANARGRIEEIARKEPGIYFVFSRADHSILAITEAASAVESCNGRQPAA